MKLLTLLVFVLIAASVLAGRRSRRSRRCTRSNPCGNFDERRCRKAVDCDQPLECVKSSKKRSKRRKWGSCGCPNNLVYLASSGFLNKKVCSKDEDVIVLDIPCGCPPNKFFDVDLNECIDECPKEKFVTCNGPLVAVGEGEERCDFCDGRVFFAPVCTNTGRGCSCPKDLPFLDDEDNVITCKAEEECPNAHQNSDDQVGTGGDEQSCPNNLIYHDTEGYLNRKVCSKEKDIIVLDVPCGCPVNKFLDVELNECVDECAKGKHVICRGQLVNVKKGKETCDFCDGRVFFAPFCTNTGRGCACPSDAPYLDDSEGFISCQPKDNCPSKSPLEVGAV